LVFGVLIPFFMFKLGRLIGFAPLLALAFLIGLAYGAVKAEYLWYDMATSAFVLAAYVALSYSAASVVSRAASSLRRE
jgi:hypothetical protein